MTASREFSRAFKTQSFLWKIIDWVYPPRCAACGTWGTRWCDPCQNKVQVIEQMNICPLCGIPQKDDTICSECAAYQPVYTALRSWGRYEGTLRKAIHHLKYRSDIGLSEELAKPLISLLHDLNWKVDLVTAVPLSKKRLHERGYNQAALLARWVGLAANIPYRPSAIHRLRDTTSQVGLHAHQRHQNVTGAFEAHAALTSGKVVLLIDDVTTTGATMQACATALHAAGTNQIYGLTLARAGQIHLD